MIQGFMVVSVIALAHIHIYLLVIFLLLLLPPYILNTDGGGSFG